MGKRKRAKRHGRYGAEEFFVPGLADELAGPFRDKEALYEARYRARLEARKNGTAMTDGAAALGNSQLRAEVAKQLSRGAKKKCCHSSPRCMRCPYVQAKLQRVQAMELDDAALRQALRNIRAA